MIRYHQQVYLHEMGEGGELPFQPFSLSTFGPVGYLESFVLEGEHGRQQPDPYWLFDGLSFG